MGSEMCIRDSSYILRLCIHVSEIKGQDLHRVRLHVKVPGWLLNFNALLTKKLPKFLSRLNEMSGGRESMHPQFASL